MALTPGTRCGPYEITGSLGAGGMGEVYRATDTKLGRAVAIKTLPGALATDAERLARFEREAQLLAALNHPHIATIYGLDEHAGTRYLAMELVEGETLEEKVKAGALPVEDALRLALQIAEALEAAHDKGVIHRDLKPANVMVTQDGVVKVLDFGLAKAFSTEPDGAAPAHSPALSLAMTQAGLILGTAGYMSPEQASGQATDQRADVWAFGVLLYEMLTGLPLFSGETVPHILADVLKTEPDWERLPKNLHPRLRLLLERCLRKKRRQRYHSIADARIDIEDILDDPAGVTAPAAIQAAAATTAVQPLSRPLLIALGALVVALGGVVGAMAYRLTSSESARAMTTFDYRIPAEHVIRRAGRDVAAFSPDGRRFVYNVDGGLYLREMDQLEARLISGTEEDLANPFFAPDGQSVAYYSVTDSALKRIAISGGAPVLITSGIEMPFGASWTSDDTILFSEGTEGVYRVPATGGTPELVIEPAGDPAFFGRPELLPGGERVLVSVSTVGPGPGFDQAQIITHSIETGETTSLVSGGSDPRYLPSGHLVYALGDTLFGVAFDAETLGVAGGAVPLIKGVQRAGATDSANYGVSTNGTLTYLAGTGAVSARLLWVSPEGDEELIPIEGSNYIYPRISPDGRRVALDDRGPGNDIWIWDFEAETRTRLDVGEDMAQNPIWTNDGSRIAYGTPSGIEWRAANNAGPREVMLDAETLETAGGQLFPYFFTPDDTRLVFRAGIQVDVGILSIGSDETPTWLLDGPKLEQNAELSPDGRWIAYESNESGQNEIYVRPFPDVDAGQVLVSNAGGEMPLWSRDGRKLFYMDDAQRRLIEVTVEATETQFGFTNRIPALDWPYRSVGFPGRTYDIARDGERFLAISEGLFGDNQRQIVVIENWVDELERLAPTE